MAGGGLCDYHMHLEPDDMPPPCPYTLERLAVYLRMAADRGLEEIGITEHCHRFREFRPIFEELVGQAQSAAPAVARWLQQDFQEPLERYVEMAVEARRRGWPVRLGLEVDFLPQRAEAIREVLAGYPWDYVVGSVHFVDGHAIDFAPDVTWPQADVQALWQRYFQLVEQAVRSGLFDVIAHLDLPKKFGHRPNPFPEAAFQRVVQALRETGVAVELNTAGLRWPAGEVYPQPRLLQILVEAGADVQLGSDAHEPAKVGEGFEVAVEVLRACGVRRLVRWRGRQRHHRPLAS